MYICVCVGCVRVYVCVYVCVYMCVGCVCIYVYVYMYVYICVYMCVCVCLWERQVSIEERSRVRTTRAGIIDGCRLSNMGVWKNSKFSAELPSLASCL